MNLIALIILTKFVLNDILYLWFSLLHATFSSSGNISLSDKIFFHSDIVDGLSSVYSTDNSRSYTKLPFLIKFNYKDHVSVDKGASLCSYISQVGFINMLLGKEIEKNKEGAF